MSANMATEPNRSKDAPDTLKLPIRKRSCADADMILTRSSKRRAVPIEQEQQEQAAGLLQVSMEDLKRMQDGFGEFASRCTAKLGPEVDVELAEHAWALETMLLMSASDIDDDASILSLDTHGLLRLDKIATQYAMTSIHASIELSLRWGIRSYCIACQLTVAIVRFRTQLLTAEPAAAARAYIHARLQGRAALAKAAEQRLSQCPVKFWEMSAVDMEHREMFKEPVCIHKPFKGVSADLYCTHGQLRKKMEETRLSLKRILRRVPVHSQTTASQPPYDSTPKTFYDELQAFANHL